MELNGLVKLSGFLPKQTPENFPTQGVCIYCGETEKLTDEHIIPFALGGTLVLEKSSCLKCAGITSKFEQTCLRTMYGALLILYDLPTRRPKERPAKLSLKVKYSPQQEEWQQVMIPQDQYPFLVTFPYFDAPGVFSGLPVQSSNGAVAKRFWIRGACPYYNFNELTSKIIRDLNAYEILPESNADISAFCKMIAKIAYSFAVAKLGLGGFESFLNPIIIKDEIDHCMHYIGSSRTDEPASNSLHDKQFIA